MIRVFIVEDNLLQLAATQAKVEDIGYTVVGTSSNSRQAWDLFNKTSIDVVLMDINLGSDEAGITLASKMQEKSDVPIIFVTAMASDHIIKLAINTSPAGYLVKPVDPIELKANIELAVQKNQQDSPKPAEKVDYITVRLGQKLRKIYFKDICYFKVESKNYVTLIDNEKKKFVVKGSIRKMLEWVFPDCFLRTHHSHGINLAYVEYIDEPSQSICLLTGESVPIGRIFKKEVYNRMNIA